MKIKLEDFMQIIPPPPVVLVSTLYGDVKNIAPFGMNMPVSFNPPLFAIGMRAAGDTYKNVIETEEFVIAIPGPDLVEAIDIAAKSFPREVSEFEKTGLTPLKSEIVKPFRVKECQSNLECVLEWVKQAGDHYLVVGRIVVASIEDKIYTKDLSRSLINPVYHVSVYKSVFARKGLLIE